MPLDQQQRERLALLRREQDEEETATPERVPTPPSEPGLKTDILKAGFPIASSIEPDGFLKKAGRVGAGALDIASLPQRLTGPLVGQKVSDPTAGVFTPPFKKFAAEQRKGATTKLKSQQFLPELLATGAEIIGETLSDPLTFTGVGAPIVAAGKAFRRFAGKPGTKALRKAGLKKLSLGGRQVQFEGSDELAAAIQKTEDLLTPAQRAAETKGPQRVFEEAFTGPGGQMVFQERRELLRKQFVDDLLPKVEKEISPNTANLTLDKTVEMLDNVIESAQKKQKKELSKRFDNLHVELEDLPIEQGGPPTLPQIKERIDAFLAEKGVVDLQGNPLSFRPATAGVSNKKTFKELQEISESLVGEDVIPFNSLRNFRSNQRNSAEIAARQGDNRAAATHNEMANVISDYMGEVAERAGKGDEFRALDVDWASFKEVTDKMRNILEKPVEQQAEKLVQLGRRDKEVLSDILNQNPDARDAVRGIIFKSLRKKSYSI